MPSLRSRPLPRHRGRTRTRPSRIALWALLLLAYSLGSMSLLARSPGDFAVAVNCGSLAPWGSGQYLTIAPDGTVAYYYQSDSSSPVSDSLFASLSMGEMEALYDTVVAVDFFGLDTLYDSGAVDGSRVAIRIIASGITHGVDAHNITIPAMKRIISTLNAILAPDSILLIYGMPDE